MKKSENAQDHDRFLEKVKNWTDDDLIYYLGFCSKFLSLKERAEKQKKLKVVVNHVSSPENKLND